MSININASLFIKKLKRYVTIIARLLKLQQSSYIFAFIISVSNKCICFQFYHVLRLRILISEKNK